MFGSDFQKRVLSLCMKDPAFATKCFSYVESSFFEPGPLRWLYHCIVSHFEKYRKLPDPVVLVEEIKSLDKDKQLLHVTVVKSVLDVVDTNSEYVRDKLTEFIKRNLFVANYTKAGEAWNEKEVEQAFKIMSDGMHKIDSISFSHIDRSYFFKDYPVRQATRMSSEISGNTKFITGISALDTITDGGLARGELGLLCGDAKAGKSIGLNHMAFACCRSKQGKVLYIVLEGSRRLTEDRLDTRFAEELYKLVKRGEINAGAESKMLREYEALSDYMVVRGMTDKWDYSVLDVDGELEELAAVGFVPDILVIDYMDLLRPRSYDASEPPYMQQTRVAQDLHTLATRRNMAVWTATQATRPKGRENDPTFKLTAKNIADSYGKVRTCDLFITINFTDDEYRNGVRRLWVDRYRDNEAQKEVTMNVDFHKMIFYSGKTDPNFGKPSLT